MVVLLRCLFLLSFCITLDMTYLVRYYFAGINENTTQNSEAAPFVTVSLVILMAVKNNYFCFICFLCVAFCACWLHFYLCLWQTA